MLPFEKYIPKVLQENLDNYGQAFIDYVDNLFTLVKKETTDLKYFYTVELIPDVFLDTIGNQFAAGILSSDTEKQKRIKILNAIAGHKKRSLWEDDIKIRIDSITGLDASLYTVIGDDDSIFTGDGLTPAAFYWSTMGCDGVDDDLGEALIGDGTEVNISGNIYIDLGGNVSSDILDQIEENISIVNKLIPSYFVIYLGYTSGTAFITLRVI